MASASAGIEGKLGALRWSRENLVPTLGICLGLQCMVIEYSRTMLGLDGASSSEFDADPAHPVIATMAEQLAIVGGDGDLGGTMRLGAYEALLTPGSVVAEAYGATKVSERHRHRYEVNNAYRDKLEEAGLVISGVSPDTSLVEFVELPRDVHPYYVSTQAHPEFKSRPDAGAPAVRRAHRGCSRPARRRVLMVADLEAPRPVVSHEVIHAGKIFDLVGDVVDLGDTQVLREYVAHPGAVAVIALDDDDRVLLLSQYRHPVRSELWEPPAGLRDVPDEELVVAAARELAEEADLVAGSWWRLVDFFTTPGGSDERIRVFLARDLRPVADCRPVHADGRGGRAWCRCGSPLDDAVDAALSGRLHSPTAVTGVLAAAAARARGWSTLEPVTV